MRAYNNHFGMVMSTVIAIILSLVMSTAAVFIDHLNWNLPLAIRNWGTCFLVITLTGWIFPLTEWSNKLCQKFGVKSKIGHGLIEDFVATCFFNLFATLVLAGVNIFHNPEIEGAVAAGAIPSAGFLYRTTVLRDLPIMFVISFVVAFIATHFALKIAEKASKNNIEMVMAMREASVVRPGTNELGSNYFKEESE